MFSLFDIVRQNRGTYYDFSTDLKTPVLRKYLIKIFMAFVLARLFSRIGFDFLNSIVTFYSVLIGFSFNVLFFLLSINNAKNESENDSLEIRIKVEKVNKLADELFYNVSYFNIVAILVMILTLLFYVFDARTANLFSHTKGLIVDQIGVPYINVGMSAAKWLMVFAYQSLYYFVLLESLDSFLRTTSRVSYYFNERKKLSS